MLVIIEKCTLVDILKWYAIKVKRLENAFFDLPPNNTSEMLHRYARA